MKVYLKDKKYTTLSDAAQNADEYVTLHKLSRLKVSVMIRKEDKIMQSM